MHCSGPLVDLILASPAANRTVVLPLSGAAASAADAGNLTTAIRDYLASRDALSDPASTVLVLPVAGSGVEVFVTFPPGAAGTAGALTLLVDAQQPAAGLVTALGTGVSGTASLGTVDATTTSPSRCVHVLCRDGEGEQLGRAAPGPVCLAALCSRLRCRAARHACMLLMLPLPLLSWLPICLPSCLPTCLPVLRPTDCVLCSRPLPTSCIAAARLST